MKLSIAKTALLAGALLGSQMASANMVSDSTTNDTVLGAQALGTPGDNFVDSWNDVGGTLLTGAHWSVNGTSNTATADHYDWFSFTGVAGNRLVVDLDVASGSNWFDTMVWLYDSVADATSGFGSAIAYNDDRCVSVGCQDNGSISGLDSVLSYTFTTTGTYYLQLGRYLPPIDIEGQPMPGNGEYLMHVGQVERGGAGEVPVPAAAWLFGSALLGFGGLNRKKKVLAA